MRLSEAIIIYLSVGASFGVYSLLRKPASASGCHALLKATRAAILWPLAAVKILFRRNPASKGRAADEVERRRTLFFERIAQAERLQHASLQKVIGLTQDLSGAERAKAERAFCTVRGIVERYVGLTLAAAESDPHAPPGEREMELCRIAGRRGDDLKLAGRCIHRRNAARLIAHQARARTELLHALAEIRELAGSAASFMKAKDTRYLSVATVRFYSHAFNLLSLLEDERAARGVARLMDAECWRLRRLEARSQTETGATEEKPCRTHAPHPIFTGPSQLEASNQQG